jgi:hypothetical protein
MYSNLTLYERWKQTPILKSFLANGTDECMNLSYTGSNTYSTFYDGTPTHMKLDLTSRNSIQSTSKIMIALEHAKDISRILNELF